MNMIINKGSIEDVLSESKKGLHVRDITKKLFYEFPQDTVSENDAIEFEKTVKDINQILYADTKRKSGGIFTKVKKGVYRLKNQRKDPLPKPPQKEIFNTIDNPIINETDKTINPAIKKDENLFKAKAGESAVMSELLFRGYNVNSMLVDDGVDIVASKNNMFYYIQVKTTSIKDNKIHATIQQKRFNDYMNTQMRYIIVSRCEIKGVETNLYFIFDNRKIQELIFGKKINSNQDRINIKIEIDLKDNKPYIYDEKRECIDFYMNNFNL